MVPTNKVMTEGISARVCKQQLNVPFDGTAKQPFVGPVIVLTSPGNANMFDFLSERVPTRRPCQSVHSWRRMAAMWCRHVGSMEISARGSYLNGAESAYGSHRRANSPGMLCDSFESSLTAIDQKICAAVVRTAPILTPEEFKVIRHLKLTGREAVGFHSRLSCSEEVSLRAASHPSSCFQVTPIHLFW